MSHGLFFRPASLPLCLTAFAWSCACSSSPDDAGDSAGGTNSADSAEGAGSESEDLATDQGEPGTQDTPGDELSPPTPNGGACVARESKGARYQLCSMPIDGEPRWFVYRVPAGYDPAAKYPMVVWYHGGGIEPSRNADGEPTGAIDQMGDAWWPYGDAHSYIVAIPLSSLEATRNLHRWFWKNGDARADYAFTEALIRWFVSEFAVDEKRVFGAGHSSGGIFLYSYASGGPTNAPAYETAKNLFRAISPSGANLLAHTVEAPISTEISVFHAHGELDTNQVWQNAEGTTLEGHGDTRFKQNRDGYWFPVWEQDTESTLGNWAAAAGCQSVSSESPQNRCWESYTYKGCQAGVDISARKLLGCGHAVKEFGMRLDYFDRFCPDGLTLCAWGEQCQAGNKCAKKPGWQGHCEQPCH